MERSVWLRALLAALIVTFVGCDPDEVTDAGRTIDAGNGNAFVLPGLNGPVEVEIDDRGMPHIYATTIHDLQMTQGFLMSRDRFVQMELLRRQVLGRLAEVLGASSPTLIDGDREQRFFGYERLGQAIYDSLAVDDPTRVTADAFVAGINAYIDLVLDTDEYLAPRGNELISIVRASPAFGHWRPSDVFSLARFQAASLSYEDTEDIRRTLALRGVRNAFDPADVADERLAARAGTYADMFSMVQARRVYTRDDFNDGTTSSLLPGGSPGPGWRPPPETAFDSFASTELLTNTLRFFERNERSPLFGGEERWGSNSWVVHGDHTATGNPILSNDPHLPLISPGVWWYVHLNTERMGGERMLDAQGVAFTGLPGVVLGYNRNLAWSATVTGYDVTDVYAETVTFRNDGTPTAPDWTPMSVRFMGADVAFETITEMIGRGDGTEETYEVLVVPHHGLVIPDSYVYPEIPDPPTGSTALGEAMSIKYTGFEVTNELAFFTQLLSATTIDEALAAQDFFEVGSQNVSYVSSSGNIGWSTQSTIPVRRCDNHLTAEGYPNLDAMTDLPGGPGFVLPGESGTHEWTGQLSETEIPHDRNPARGYIATANQAGVPVTDDNNPCNDTHYLGSGFASGFRMGRIVERLEELTATGGITTADMIEMQADSRSTIGASSRDAIVASLDHALGDLSDDPALRMVVEGAGVDGVADLTDARARLAAWTFATPHGVGATDASEIADSVATTIFNAMMTRLTVLAFDDEVALIGQGPSSGLRATMIEWALMSQADQMALPLRTFRANYASITGYNDTVLWDDISTNAIVETRDERVTSALLAALEWLDTELGSDWDEWRWGRLHAVRFEQIVEPIGDPGIVSIPVRGSTEFPLGFPRHGDYGAIDVGNYSYSNGTRFTYGSGPSQRLVVEMTSTGPIAFNALPGGQTEDPDRPHHADEAELWRNNVQPMMHFDRADIEANTEESLRFVPSN